MAMRQSTLARRESKKRHTEMLALQEQALLDHHRWIRLEILLNKVYRQITTKGSTDFSRYEAIKKEWSLSSTKRVSSLLSLQEFCEKHGF